MQRAGPASTVRRYDDGVNRYRTLAIALGFGMLLAPFCLTGREAQDVRSPPEARPSGSSTHAESVTAGQRVAARSAAKRGSAVQAALRAVAEHDPTGTVWAVFDGCVALPDAEAYRNESTAKLLQGRVPDRSKAYVQDRVAKAEALLAAPYAEPCLDAFTWMAANPEVHAIAEGVR